MIRPRLLDWMKRGLRSSQPASAPRTPAPLPLTPGAPLPSPARPDWWPCDRLGMSGRYTVDVVSDGESYGFTRRGDASAFVARLDALTEKSWVFNDHGRHARGRGRRRGKSVAG